MRNNRTLERRPARPAARPVGAMAERVTSDVPSYARILQRFGIIGKDQKLSTTDAWSEFLNVASDPEVMRVRESLGKVQQRTGILNSYVAVEAALCKMSADPDAILRLRARLLARYTL